MRLMASTHLQVSTDLSWSALKRKADLLGVPAWKLAEEFTFHAPNGSLVVKGESSYRNELNSK